MSYQLLSLQRASHSIPELLKHALPYIERSREEFTPKQKAAFEFFSHFFVDDAEYEKLEQRLSTRMGAPLGPEIIAKIGDLFLFEGLENVGFDWQGNANPDDEGILARTTNMLAHLGTPQAINFYAGHRSFQKGSVAARRKSLFEAFFHEAIHALDQRYGRDVRISSFTGHHVGFNLIAEPIERQPSSLFGVDFDLNRALSFVDECMASKSVDMTQADLDKCFPGKFTYEAFSRSLYHHKAGRLDLNGPRPYTAPHDIWFPSHQDDNDV